ncbi:MAG: CRISPR-associated RAMP protein [Nitrospirae bacterium]|nr:CRISPR-associated RAMP protein [Nitrospirota bacterium]
MFERLENRYFFRGELVLENEMHIGSGKGDGTTDALVVKDFSDKPIIPGSSLRGILRSTIERIASSLGKNPCMLTSINCVTNSRVLQDEFKKLLEEKDSSKIMAFLNNNSKICPVCRLFGSTVVASKIRVTDLLLRNERSNTSIRHGVGINRDTETSQDKAKFDFEVVPRGSRFSLELIGENLTNDDLALLAVGIQEMSNGNFWIGGNTARGLGKCRLEKLEIKYFSDADRLKKYLRDGEKGLDSLPLNEFYACINTLV